MSQITFDEDYNVPDARPDGADDSEKGEVTIGDADFWKEKRVYLAAPPFICCTVLTANGRIRQPPASLIDETIHLDGLTGGDKVCITWEVEDLNLHLINSRKLAYARSSRCTRGSRNCATLPCRWKSAGERRRGKRQNTAWLSLQCRKDVLRVKKELTIPSGKPELHEILWQDLEVRGLDLRSGGGAGQCAGRTPLCLLSVQRRRGGSPAAVGGAGAPFQAEVECQGCISEMIRGSKAHSARPHRNPARFRRRGAGPAGGGRTRNFLDIWSVSGRNRITSAGRLPSAPRMHSKSAGGRLESLLIRNSSKCRLTDKLQMRVPKIKFCRSATATAKSRSTMGKNRRKRHRSNRRGGTQGALCRERR